MKVNKNLLIILCVLALSTQLGSAIRLSAGEYAALSDQQLENSVSFTHYNTSLRNTYVVFSFTMSTYSYYNQSFYNAVYRKTAELPFDDVAFCLRNFAPMTCWNSMVLAQGYYNQSGYIGMTVRGQVRVQKESEFNHLLSMRDRANRILNEQNRSSQVNSLLNLRMS